MLRAVGLGSPVSVATIVNTMGGRGSLLISVRTNRTSSVLRRFAPVPNMASDVRLNGAVLVDISHGCANRFGKRITDNGVIPQHLIIHPYIVRVSSRPRHCHHACVARIGNNLSTGGRPFRV